jgi:hypothetical protein
VVNASSMKEVNKNKEGNIKKRIGKLKI